MEIIAIDSASWLNSGRAVATQPQLPRQLAFVALIGSIDLVQNEMIAYSEAKLILTIHIVLLFSTKNKSLIAGSVKVGGMWEEFVVAGGEASGYS